MKIRRKQRGLALLIVFFFLALIMVSYTLKSVSTIDVQNEREKKSLALLAQAKAALIGHAIGQIGSGQRPGSLLRPDSFANSESPKDYDGTAETGCLDASAVSGLPQILSGANLRCLGRLPWKDLGMVIKIPSENDPTGEMPWYAVSGNLVDLGCLGSMNSEVLNTAYTGYNCPSTTLPYPWLTVRDKYGNLLSNRVAAVLILPGTTLTGQARPSSPSLADATQYLDSVTVTNAAGCTATHVAATYNNAGMNNEFIMGVDSQRVSQNDPCLQQPYQFNDKLVYITIDELMEAVEKRVAQEAASALRSYYIASSAIPANRYFPYAATLGDVNNACVNSKLSGLISLAPASATCTSSTSCVVSFPMTKVVYNLSAGNYTSITGSCNRAANICTCTGAGRCTKSGGSGSVFACNASGSCTSTGASPSGTFQFIYTPKTPDTTATTGLCSGSAGTVTCTNTGTFFSTATNCPHPNLGLSTLPAWFTDNNWQDLITYHLSNDCTFATPGCVTGLLTVGVKTNVHALLISASKKLPSQAARPSNNLINYLDSPENTNGDLVFDAVGKPRTNTYNDQMFIVAP